MACGIKFGSKKKTYYHYTSKENLAAIEKEGKINPSSSGAYGGGKVYMTTKPPSSGKGAIARNNYDDGTRFWQGKESSGFCDAHVEVRLKKKDVKKEKDPDGRDIYTHKGPVKLKKK